MGSDEIQALVAQLQHEFGIQVSFTQLLLAFALLAHLADL